MNKKKIIIVGGGLAGLTAALQLASYKMEVMLFEKKQYPRHKVCGEYISNEVLPYLVSLGINPYDHGAVTISEFKYTSLNQKATHSKLPLGGFGISRYALDELLYKKAIALGCKIITKQIVNIHYRDNQFTVFDDRGHSWQAAYVIGAFGKRSNLDISLSRKFIKHPSPWLGVKAHYRANVPSDQVSLHNFKGGYCGISKVENNAVNVCYLVNYKMFKKYKDLDAFRKNIMSANPFLKDFFEEGQMLFEKPITISQVSFEPKKVVHNHILMCGDSASMIHPLCGNGMAMAIHAAKLLSDCLHTHIIDQTSRKELENDYTTQWRDTFRSRRRWGKLLQTVLQNETLSTLGMRLLTRFPSILPRLIRFTHGKSTLAI